MHRFSVQGGGSSMPRRMRVRLFVLTATLPLVLWASLPLTSTGQTGRIASIQSKIEKKRAEVEAKKRRERVLASEVARYSQKIGSLQGDITALQRKQVSIQADLDRKRAELAEIQADLRAERLRLQRLRARLAEARQALAVRLVELYKADKPDVVTEARLEAEAEGENGDGDGKGLTKSGRRGDREIVN